MENVKKQQIKQAFGNWKKLKGKGIWFSGFEHEGEYKEWYSDGGPRWRYYFYKNGKIDGEYKEFNKLTNNEVRNWLKNRRDINNKSIFDAKEFISISNSKLTGTSEIVKYKDIIIK